MGLTRGPKAFCCKKDESAWDAVTKRIDILHAVSLHHLGYKLAIEGHDPDEGCTPYQRFNIARKCQYIAFALVAAKTNMHLPQWNWMKCYNKAVEYPRKLGIWHCKNGQTVL